MQTYFNTGQIASPHKQIWTFSQQNRTLCQQTMTPAATTTILKVIAMVARSKKISALPSLYLRLNKPKGQHQIVTIHGRCKRIIFYYPLNP